MAPLKKMYVHDFFYLTGKAEEFSTMVFISVSGQLYAGFSLPSSIDQYK